MKNILLTSLGLFACATLMGQQLIQASDIGSFSAVKLSGRMNVELIQSVEKRGLEVELTNAETKNLDWSVANHKLSVSLRPARNASAKVKIYYKELTDIAASDVELASADTIKSNMLNITVGSGAKVSLTVLCDDTDVAVSGNSALSLSGNTKYLTLLATENSKVDSRQLGAVSANVESAIAAEIYVAAQERLVARAKTGSTIFYKGEPSILRIKKGSMGATVNNIGK